MPSTGKAGGDSARDRGGQAGREHGAANTPFLFTIRFIIFKLSPSTLYLGNENVYAMCMYVTYTRAHTLMCTHTYVCITNLEVACLPRTGGTVFCRHVNGSGVLSAGRTRRGGWSRVPVSGLDPRSRLRPARTAGELGRGSPGFGF